MPRGITRKLSLAGSAVRAWPDRSAGVQVQNKRLQHPVPLPQDQVGRQRQDRRRHAQVLQQRGRLPHAGELVRSGDVEFLSYFSKKNLAFLQVMVTESPGGHDLYDITLSEC